MTYDDALLDDDEIEIIGNGQPLVPDGQYRVRMIGHENTTILGGLPKKRVDFEIIEGPEAGAVVSAWQNLKPTKGDGRGRFALGRNSKLAKKMRDIARQRGRNMSSTRPTLAVLRDVDLAVETYTTGKEVPYSVVGKIAGVWDKVAPAPATTRSFNRVSEGGGDGDSNGDGDEQHKQTTLPTNDSQPMTDDGELVTDDGELVTDDGELVTADVIESFTPDDDHRALATDVGVDVEYQAAKFRDYYLAKGQSPHDCAAAFRNWIRRAPSFGDTVNAASSAIGMFPDDDA